MLLFVDGEIYRGVGSVAWCGYFAVHTWLVTPLDLILLDILPALTRIGIEQHFNVELISDISKFFMTVSHHIRLHHDVISIWGVPPLLSDSEPPHRSCSNLVDCQWSHGSCPANGGVVLTWRETRSGKDSPRGTGPIGTRSSARSRWCSLLAPSVQRRRLHTAD